MDPIHFAIQDLARAGIEVSCSEPFFLQLYSAPGYPELTRNQVFALAQQRGIPSPPQASGTV